MKNNLVVITSTAFLVGDTEPSPSWTDSMPYSASVQPSREVLSLTTHDTIHILILFSKVVIGNRLPITVVLRNYLKG